PISARKTEMKMAEKALIMVGSLWRTFVRVGRADSGSKMVARVASVFCEQPWKWRAWELCRVSGTGRIARREISAHLLVPLTRHAILTSAFRGVLAKGARTPRYRLVPLTRQALGVHSC